MNITVLECGVRALGLPTPTVIAAALGQYLDLISKWNRVHNLTAIHDPERMVVEHALDSLSITSLIRPARILDVGSGAGLPGIPLAIANPQWHLTLLDSSQKRCAFMRQAVIELGLSNVEIVCARVEQFQPAILFDTIVSRAFAQAELFAQSACGLLAHDGVMIAMKGVYPEEELARLSADVGVREIVKLHVPGLLAERHAVVMTKV